MLDDGREIRFRDVRKFGRIGLYAADDDPFDGLGPEPLDPRFTLRAWRARLRGRRARLKPLLVDQSFVAGIGNIYADEALWRSRLHPLRSAASLRPTDERALYRNVLEILAEAVERRGSSIDDYTAPDGDGEMQERLDVYQRTGQPCPRCGRPIRRIVIGIRATHFCSFCQRLPAAERPAAAKLLATMTPRPGRAASGRRGRRWVELDGEGALGRTADEAALARERAARTKAAAAARRAAARTGAGRAAARAPDDDARAARRARHRGCPMSLVRLEGVVREIGTFVILDRIDAAIAAGRAGRPRRSQRRRQDDAAADRGRPRRGRPRDGHAPPAVCPSGCSARRRTSTRRSWPRPDLRAAVRHGAAHLEKMAAELEHLEHGGHAAGNRYADLQHRFEILGGYTLDQRVDEALSGLGFARDEWLRPPTALSGGQQTRAALARLVVADPDLLLLDEPTNHLDINAIEWLEEHLRRRSGALLVASHDRAFLDATVARVWELRDRRLTVFRGDYCSYHRQRVERDLRAEKEAESQSDAMEREIELVQRYRSQRKHTKMHEHEARLEKLKADRIEAPRKSSRTPAAPRALDRGRAGPVRRARRAHGGHGRGLPAGSRGAQPGRHRGAGARDRGQGPVPRRPARRADRHRRVPTAPARRPCCGRSRATCRRSTGSIAFGHQVQPGYLAQLRDAAIPGATVLDAIMEAIPVTPGEARGYLARFLFRGDDVFKEVRALSGGERSRLELALLGILPANLLLLDEPTNHLDIAAREAIEAFLAETPGDAAGRLARPPAARDDLRAAVGGRRGTGGAVRRRIPGLAPGGGGRMDRGGRGEPAPEPAPPGYARLAPGCRIGPDSPPVARAARRLPRRSAVDRRRLATTPAERPKRRPKLSKEAYRRRREALDAELARLGLRKSQLELAMGTPSIAANFVEMRRVTSELADVDRALAEAEDAWLELEELAP